MTYICLLNFSQKRIKQYFRLTIAIIRRLFLHFRLFRFPKAPVSLEIRILDTKFERALSREKGMLPSRASDSRVKRTQPETPGTSLFPCMENSDIFAFRILSRTVVVKFPRTSRRKTRAIRFEIDIQTFYN